MPVVKVPVTSYWRMAGWGVPMGFTFRFSKAMSVSVSPSKTCMRSARRDPMTSGGSPDSVASVRLASPSRTRASMSVTGGPASSRATP